MLTQKQIKQFVDWYKELYWIDSYTEVAPWNKWLPCIFDHEEEKHIQMWKDKLTRIIWPRKSKREYIHKWWRKDTILWKVFSDLWLWYWPIVIKDSWWIIKMVDGRVFKTKNHADTIQFLSSDEWAIESMEKINKNFYMIDKENAISWMSDLLSSDWE